MVDLGKWNEYSTLGNWIPVPSASLAMSWSLPVVPSSIPDLSVSSESNIDDVRADESVLSVTWFTFMGLPANSKPFNCSSAFLASSALENVINAYPLDRLVSGSLISSILSMGPNGSKMPRNMSSVILK